MLISWKNQSLLCAQEIIKDFTPFLVIFIWFLLSVTAGFWSLKCTSSQIAREDQTYSFAMLFQEISLIPFETQFPDQLQECFGDESMTSSIAHGLLWYLIFMLPLLSLNALIAIMGSTYQNVKSKHNQQQYKEWAQIIGDVVRQWPERKRADWEKQFYWIHTLKPRKGTDTSDTTTSTPFLSAPYAPMDDMIAQASLGKIKMD
jgi:hypothetical protein